MWIFGYGSLIWKTEFEYLKREIAYLDGFKRDFCVKTHVHRGNDNQFGLVLGLIKKNGFNTKGVAYKICDSKIDIVMEYLNIRELSEDIYYPEHVYIKINNKKVKALTYLVNKESSLFIEDMSIKNKAKIIKNSHGNSGKNIDYFLNTKEKLIQMGVKHEDFFDIEKYF